MQPMSAYDTTKQIITDTIKEFGGQAHGLDNIIVDRIKDAGLKIEKRANATSAAKQTAKQGETEANSGEGE